MQGADTGNSTGNTAGNQSPMKRGEAPGIKHAFLKRLALILLVLFMNLLILTLIYVATFATVVLFFIPASSIGAYIARQAILVVALFLFVGPIYIGRAIIKLDDGLEMHIKEREQPELFGLMTEAATAVGTYPVKQVSLRPDAILAVDIGSSNLSLFPRRARIILGLALLNGMTVHEMKAGFAHEYAHVRLGKGWSGLFIRYGMTQLSAIFAVFLNNRVGRITSLANPFFWIFRLIAAAIGPWGEEIMRWHEYQADIAAGRMYGSDAVVSGQQKGLINSFAFEMAVEKCKRWLEGGKLRVDDIIAYAGRIRDAMNDTDRRQILAREEVLIGRFDGTHPSPALRAEAVEKFACKVSEDCRPAMEALRDVVRLRGELTDRIYKFLEERFEIKAASPRIVKADELPLSYTESELGNILEKFAHESGKKGLSVTYDLDGLKRADRFFAAHPEFFKVPPEKDIIGDLILYFGETIRRMHGGEWVFPVVAPPRLKEVGPHKLNLEVFEIFMSELAASHYPATHPAYIRAIDRLGIKESSDTTPKPPGPVV